MRDSRPRLVATDLDGTLLRSDLSISPFTRRVLQGLEDLAIHVVFVTARPPRWMAPLADAVSGHGKAICLNGAAIYDFETETAHAIGGFLHDDMAAIVSDLRRELPGVAFALERASGAVFDPGFISSHPADATTQVGLVESFNDEPTGKLLARLSELPDEEFFSRVESIVGSRATLAYSGASGLAELSPAGISKAGALEQWCTEHGIDSRDVWAFGDMPNDIPMLSWAGRGIAVSNAHQDALAVADAITTSNDDDGVARALLHLLHG